MIAHLRHIQDLRSYVDAVFGIRQRTFDNLDPFTADVIDAFREVVRETLPKPNAPPPGNSTSEQWGGPLSASPQQCAVPNLHGLHGPSSATGNPEQSHGEATNNDDAEC